MNQRSVVLFLPSLLLIAFASHNIIKKRRHAAEVTRVAVAIAPVTITPSRAPASFGSATALEVKPVAIQRVSLAFAQDLLQQRLADKKMPPSALASIQRYEEKLKALSASDGYPDRPEIFLSRLCEEGTSGACPLLWNLWQQPGTNDESETRKTAVLLLSCVETGDLCLQAIEAHRGSVLEEALHQLTKNYCDGGIQSACEEVAAPLENRSRSRMPASEQPESLMPTPISAEETLRTASLRRCENDSAVDCSQIAILEARDNNLDAASDYAEFSCAAGLPKGCLQLAKLRYQKTRNLGATRESLQRICSQPQMAAANISLCRDLGSGTSIDAHFFTTHRELRNVEGLSLATNLPQYFVANW